MARDREWSPDSGVCPRDRAEIRIRAPSELYADDVAVAFFHSLPAPEPGGRVVLDFTGVVVISAAAGQALLEYLARWSADAVVLLPPPSPGRLATRAGRHPTGSGHPRRQGGVAA